jgi:hypothetical protein
VDEADASRRTEAPGEEAGTQAGVLALLLEMSRPHGGQAGRTELPWVKVLERPSWWPRVAREGSPVSAARAGCRARAPESPLGSSCRVRAPQAQSQKDQQGRWRQRAPQAQSQKDRQGHQ